jgi:3-methyladenine DNA glycosylase Tag
MPDRGLLAHSAPTKRSRYVASRWASPIQWDLPARDVRRLKSLLLIEEFRAGLRVTPIGKKRYLALPNSAAFDSGEGLAKMAEFISKARA